MSPDERLLREANREVLNCLLSAYASFTSTFRALFRARDGTVLVVRYEDRVLLAADEPALEASLSTELGYRYLLAIGRHALWPIESCTAHFPRRTRGLSVERLQPSEAAAMARDDPTITPRVVSRWLELADSHHLAMMVACCEGARAATVCALATNRFYAI